VVIFQHGITRDRSDAFAVAGAFASAGYVVASIDLPLHGVTNTASPLYQATNEQTFNLDLIVNASGASGPDSVIDPTGIHFINLPFPLASRDNLRQGAVNLLALTRALPTLDLDANPATVDVDPTRIAFVGHSLGAITGVSYAWAVPAPPLLRSVALANPGGGVAELLRDSATFGPRINAALGAQGLMPGTTVYAQYFRDVQNIVDAGDPINYMGGLITQRPIYLNQVVGGSGTTPSLPDQVVPNSATARLIAAATAGGAAFPRVLPGVPRVGSGYVNFTAGDHGSILSPAASAAATVEMQTEVVTFTVTGNTIVATNPAVVQP
jgi:pimeloyl-ACP methyl ester carboxylesterase